MKRDPQWLVAYDVRDPRRLARIGRYMKGQGVHLQYSVFLVRAAPSSLAALADGLRQRMDERADDIRIYRLPRRPQWTWLGRQPLPEQVLLLDDRGAWLPGSQGVSSADATARVGGVKPARGKGEL